MTVTVNVFKEIFLFRSFKLQHRQIYPYSSVLFMFLIVLSKNFFPKYYPIFSSKSPLVSLFWEKYPKVFQNLEKYGMALESCHDA